MNLRDERIKRADLFANHVPESICPAEVRELVDKVKPVNPTFREGLCNAVSAIKKKDVDSFLEHGWRTVYQEGFSWHLDFGSTEAEAMRARTFNDERLFGTTCVNFITFAMLNCYGVGDHPDKLWDHMQRYGDYVISWKDTAWMNDATVTWGDSQQNVMAFPYSEDMVNKLLAIHTDTGINVQPCIDSGAFNGEHNPYLEIQIHKKLTDDDVSGYMIKRKGEVISVDLSTNAG